MRTWKSGRFLFFFLFLLFLLLPSPGAAETRYKVPIGDSPSIGPADAPVVIIEFLDYQ